MKPQDLSSRYQPDLDACLRSMVGDSSLQLYTMMRYHLGWVDTLGRSVDAKGGKLLRPGLCLLGCESVGGDWRAALPAAAALELTHNFTLIHDDIEDDDHQRRGVDTVWHVWGQAQGINAGDAMHSLAGVVLLELEGNGVDPLRIVHAARLLDETCLKVCEGQYLDISYENRLDVGTDEYLEMIGKKTAALFSCSLKMGALLGTADVETIEAMAGFGYHLGMAFQIQDDILGIWGESHLTGKSTTSDISKKKKTLPVLYGIDQSTLRQKEVLIQIYNQENVGEVDVQCVLNALNGVNARAYAEGIAADYYEKCLGELIKADVPQSAREEMRDLARFMIERDY